MLVDEINRAMPKTQSALLEAMAERQVTVDGVTRRSRGRSCCSRPRTRSSTRARSRCPEAQLDRFFLKTSLGYPSIDEELLVIDDQRVEHPLGRLRPVTTLEEIESLQESIGHVYVDQLIARWIVELVQATRAASATAVGASVRGSLALERAVRAWALLARSRLRHAGGRRRLFSAVLGHRVVFTPAKLAEARQLGMAAALDVVQGRVHRSSHRRRCCESKTSTSTGGPP